MQVKPEQLPQQLKSGLKPVYMVSGEEPLLQLEAVDEIRAAARAQGYDERQVLRVERGFDWQTLQEEGNALSLFATKRIIELKLPNGKPGTEGSKKLVQYLEAPPEDTVLIIEAGKIDKKTLGSAKWCKAIDKLGVITQVWPIKPQQTLTFMRQRANKLKLNIDYDALEILSSRLEGNPLAAKQELDKLAILHGNNTISVGMILDEVKDSARYDVFDLSKAMLSGQAKKTASIVGHLKAEGNLPITMIWPLSRDVRVLEGLIPLIGQQQRVDAYLKGKRIFAQQQADYVSAAKRLNTKSINDLTLMLKKIDDASKGVFGSEPAWLLIEQLAMHIAHPPK
ncbi:MAG: DNA polymerase III subunit delta [Oleiphilaceae bacterium]|nr:DNA polymerase III subunit delta [Oleiphilaceae bacterium]